MEPEIKAEQNVDAAVLSALVRERRRKNRIDALAKACNAKIAAMKDVVVEQFVQAGVTSMRVDGATVYLVRKSSTELAVLPGETKLEAAERAARALTELGLEVLVGHPTVINVAALADMFAEEAEDAKAEKAERPAEEVEREAALSALIKRSQWCEVSVRVS